MFKFLHHDGLILRAALVDLILCLGQRAVRIHLIRKLFLKVVYLGRPNRKTNPTPSARGEVIELLSNNWNDHGFQTTFETSCRLDGRLVSLGFIRLLVDGERYTSDFLDRLLVQGWNGRFPIPDVNYVSVPAEITFYDQLEATVSSDVATRVAQKLRDASYLVHIAEDEDANALIASEGFQKSLQRERGSVKAFLDGWKIFDQQAIAVLNLGFRFKDVFDNVSTLNLKFQSDSVLPHDINALIGPNGSGKSRVLHQIVDDWISDDEEEGIGFTSKPNLSQLVVVSYSPFERFPVDLSGESLQDQNAYRYFGFRGRSQPTTASPRGRVRLSHDFPKQNAAQALLACLADDQRYHAITKWAQKLRTVEEVLRKAIDFDYAAVRVESNRLARRFYTNTAFVSPLFLQFPQGDGSTVRYVPISSNRISQLNHDTLTEYLIPSGGVKFFKDGEPLELSSGQRLFAYVVINILGAIRRNSLILVDEPELFLHPTLEIQFVDMLKGILAQFNSKALLATHSVVTVREMPADCVHVFEKTEDGLVVKHPPFQTFGGDFQRISSYVFGDRSVSKPFEHWIKTKIEQLGSGTALLEALGNEVNEELVVQIKAMERGQW